MENAEACSLPQDFSHGKSEGTIYQSCSQKAEKAKPLILFYGNAMTRQEWFPVDKRKIKRAELSF
jgi:hypothetical protein